MERLFDGEGETGDLMVEMRCPDAEAGLIPELPRKRARRQVPAPEGLSAGKARPPDGVGIDLKDLETEGVALDKVPGVPSELSLHVADDPWGPEEAQDAIAAQDRSEELIETDEVIEVGMRDEDFAHPEEIPGRHGGNRAQIKEEGAPRPPDPHEKGRGLPRAVDQP